MRRLMARRWADRIIRNYASAALRGAGFLTASCALASVPELDTEESLIEARARVNAALTTVLLAREVPWTERALVATFAAREAIAVAQLDDPSSDDLKTMVAALHTTADDL